MCGRYYFEISDEEMMSIIQEVERKANRPEQLVKPAKFFRLIVSVMVYEQNGSLRDR